MVVLADTVSLAPTVGGYSELGLLVAAVVGFFFVRKQIRASKEIAAQDAYEKYHHLGLQYPHLSSGLANYKVAPIDDRRRYHWFVLSMLLTVEKIVTLFPADPYWRNAVEDDLKMHLEYINSEEFLRCRKSLDPRVVSLIDAVNAQANVHALDVGQMAANKPVTKRTASKSHA